MKILSPHPFNFKSKGFALGLFLLVSFFYESQAQLKADFVIDNPGGCSPLVVSFKNTSTGASTSATYEWDFGNGNKNEKDKDAQAVYHNEMVYTVKLTVKDGNQTATAEKKVTVYKKPSASISFNSMKGCAPFPVTITADAKAGDGTISKFVWDFGDGNVDSISNRNIVSHTYTSGGNPPVTLTVLNSHGCYTTIDKSGLVVLPTLTADFAASDSVLCTVGQTVNFINKSTGPGVLSYHWDWGDGNTSGQTNTSKTYPDKGSYDVSLIATNTDGCSDTLTKQGYINVANFTSDFISSETICTNIASKFTNNSFPAPGSSNWLITESGGRGSGPEFSYVFPDSGTYHVKLTNTFGKCTESVSKEFKVKKGTAIKNFIAETNSVCGTPVTVQFKDTSKTAVSWNWNFGIGSNTDDKKETNYTYNTDGDFEVKLTVTDAQGCSNIVSKTLSLHKPDVQIVDTGANSGCPGFGKKFDINIQSNLIKTFEWDFGDGDSSTSPAPYHIFNKNGSFPVTLKYTTQNGCTGKTKPLYIKTEEKPVADFSVNATQICGSNQVVFTDLSTGNIDNWGWDYGDGGGEYNQGNWWYPGRNNEHNYQEAGEYTITLIVGSGVCRDTMKKESFLKVLPPFPMAEGYNMSCNSGEVTLYQNHIINAATKMWWDFGDGITLEINPSAQTTTHVYDSSKTYKAYLIAENGECTVKDSINVPVLQRQQPVLTASLTEVCGSGNLKIDISGLDKNPSMINDYYNHYSIYGWVYADGQAASPNLSVQQSPFVNHFEGTLTNLENGQSGIRVILVPNSSPACPDTSNVVPLTIKGPKAGFSSVTNNLCFKNPIIFKDQSVPDSGVPIKNWEWDFGDDNKYTHADSLYPLNGLVSHLYDEPGYYYPILTVTDQDGCSGKALSFNNPVKIKGPKAAFEYSPEKIFPGTLVSFYNYTNYANSSPQYNWRFTNGSPTYNGANPPNKTYNDLGKDSITLIAKDPLGCTDTAVQVLYIKDVAASFTFKENYITSSSCPPVIINFTSTSDNAERLKWDFGTGGIDDDNRINTNHTYYKPGVYRVVLYAYGTSTRIDSSVTYITIKGPYAVLRADTLSGCLNQKVTLNASVKNASSFTWDFGDGSIMQTTDTFAVHSYSHSGVYTPALVLKDGSGCSGTSELPDKIVIDSLAIIKLQPNPAQICDSAMVLFQPEIKSIAAEVLNQSLTFEWDYGTGILPVINTDPNSSHFYNKPGKYEVSLSVSSSFGCIKRIEDSVVVIPTPHGNIMGPSSICEDNTALFTGHTDLSTLIKWQWNFQNGNYADIQNPEKQLYTKAADSIAIRLITENKGCMDTTLHLLSVHKRPDVDITPRDPILCLGNQVQLIAHDGTQYKWLPVPGLNQYNLSNPLASPTDNTTFQVEVTNAFGCKRSDSVSVTVVKPSKVLLNAATYVCYGSAVQLPAAGTDQYQWINNISGLSSTNTAQPFASPSKSTTYTVVGYDQHKCFSDTAEIFVDVKALPAIQLPADMELPTGSEVYLPGSGSNDIVKWNWSPGDYLNCSTCSSPISRPRSDISYVVTVANQYECTSSDTLSIKLVCAQGLVYIPNAFSPNNDRLNDVFYVKGRGIRSIKSMRVFNRWGELVFETANAEIDDITKGWDGRHKGKDAESATYVYYVELICDTGEIFTRKGTVTLIR